jgi:hypothetical protein
MSEVLVHLQQRIQAQIDGGVIHQGNTSLSGGFVQSLVDREESPRDVAVNLPDGSITSRNLMMS